MKKLKSYNRFIKESLKEEAFQIINESVVDFMDKVEVTDVDVEALTKVQDEVIDQYDLPDIDIESIKSRISGAITQKVNINID